MTQPFSGITPPDLGESPLMTVWPTIGANAPGRFVGVLCGNRIGFGFFTLGKLLALAAIPLSLCVYAWQLMPFVCRRYTITNRRVVIRKGLGAVEGRWISLDEFDNIQVSTLSGQAWLHCGDLILRHGETELLRLAGVPRPEQIRHVCLKARLALTSVREVLQREAAMG